jgi:hypothetical protein
MADEDVPEEGGPEPADEPDEGGAVAVEDEAPVEAPSFAVDDIAQGLGSVFQERFLAHHEPAEAIRLYGEARDHLQSAYGRIAQGGEPTQEDIDAAEALGIELPAPAEPDAVEPLWGAPWAEPTTMDEFYALANARPDQAMAFIDANPGKVNDETRQQVLAYWAENDRAAAISYEREQARAQAISEAKAYADEQLAALREELTPLHSQNEAALQAQRVLTAKDMVHEARAGIPDFDQHEEGVIALIEEGMRQYGPTYFENILSATPEARLQYLSDLTGAAAWRSRPAAQAEADEQQKAAEAAKVGAGSERGRGGASTPGNATAQSEMKKKFTEDIRRAVENPA